MINYDSCTSPQKYESSGTSQLENVARRTNDKGNISASRFLHDVIS